MKFQSGKNAEFDLWCKTADKTKLFCGYVATGVEWCDLCGRNIKPLEDIYGGKWIGGIRINLDACVSCALRYEYKDAIVLINDLIKTSKLHSAWAEQLALESGFELVNMYE